LRVVRDGQEKTIEGRLPAAQPVLGRQMVYASGVVFGQAREFDPSEINYSRVAACHIEDGSLGESAGFESCDAIETVDGEPLADLDQLYRRLDAARKDDRAMRVSVKRIVGLKGKSFFEYRELSLPVEELHWLRVEDRSPGGGN
jgi:membrane-associated protease RseP (regulator of RpoE activity)